MNMRITKTTYKLGFALLGLSAVVTEIATLTERGVFQPTNFFSFFTIQSNIVAIVVLLIGALMTFAAKKNRSFDVFRGAATFYMAVTGVVFSLLLSGLQDVNLTAVPWDNIVLHYIMPIVLVADWLFDAPVRRISFKKALLWLLYPLAYFVYSLVRGAMVSWYPYPFLNPTNGGYASVLITAAIITVVGIAAVWLFSRVGKKA